MAKPRALIVRSPGINCDEETAYAFEVVGAQASAIHINQLVDDSTKLQRFQVICVPGGFSYGDDVSAGQVLAVKVRRRLGDALRDFVSAGNLVLGICNGFQVLIKAGLLVSPDDSGLPATLTWNTCGRYVDRWVTVRPNSSTCVFLNGIDSMYLPIAHAEGRLVARDDQTLSELQSREQLALTYVPDHNGDIASNLPDADPSLIDPNPNGSHRDVAGLCDVTGRVLGLMPHPERNIHRTHHPRWTRQPRYGLCDGLKLFQNAVDYFA